MQAVIAYLDPGSGSIVLQAILGGLGGVALLWARMRHRIRRKLGRGGAVEPEAGTDAAAGSDEDAGGTEPAAGEPERAEERSTSQ